MRARLDLRSVARGLACSCNCRWPGRWWAQNQQEEYAETQRPAQLTCLLLMQAVERDRHTTEQYPMRPTGAISEQQQLACSKQLPGPLRPALI